MAISGFIEQALTFLGFKEQAVTPTIPSFSGFMEHTLTFLETKEQSAVQRTCQAWCKSSLSNPGRYAQMMSIVSLSDEEITELENAGFSFAEFFKEKSITDRLVKDEVNPYNKVSKEYLTAVLQAKCKNNPHEMLSFLTSLSSEVRNGIQLLDLDNEELNGEHITQALMLCPNLEALNITSSSLTSIHLPEDYENTKLKKISLYSSDQLDEESFKLFFQKMASLEDLSIKSSKATGNMFLGLNPNHFKKLKMSCCFNLDQDTLGAFFNAHAKLEELSIENSNVSLIALEQIPANSKLKKMTLQKSYLEKVLDEQLTFLFSKLKEVEELTLIGFQDITGSALYSLDVSKLKSLRLGACLMVNDKILEGFFKKLKNLEILDLRNTEITESVLKALDPSKLKVLRLWSEFTEEALSEFFAKIVNLEKLDLAHTDTTGVPLLSLNASKLKELTLNSCEKINENILSKFFEKTVSLAKLDLSNTYIWGECLQNVEPYQLKELHVYGCRFLDIKYINKFPEGIIFL
ncbi:MAG: hypothetical protein PVI40_08225 [Chlamydiota bacterium]|jgi:hypothetical protein